MEQKIYEIIDRLKIAIDDQNWEAVEDVVELLEEYDADRESFIDSNYFNLDE